WLTAGLFAEVVEHALPSLAPVRQLLAGGDVLPVEGVDRVRRAYPHCQVINGYGPTENTTFSCCYRIPASDDLQSGVSIGSPIANSRAYHRSRSASAASCTSRVQEWPAVICGAPVIQRNDSSPTRTRPVQGLECTAPAIWRAGGRTGRWNSSGAPTRR